MELNYTEKGIGPAIIMVHGWGGSSQSLEKLAELLANNGFRTINIDLPGFGKSPAPQKALTMEDYAKGIMMIIKRLELDRPIYIGHSFGGKIGLFFSVMYPSVLSRLILVNSAGLKPKRSLKQKITHALAKIGGPISWIPPFLFFRPIIKFIYYRFVVREMDYYKAKSLKETFKTNINRHIDADLDKIKTDTLIIWGRKDTYTPVWMGEKLASKIKNSRLEVIDEVGHGLPLVYPQIVAELVINFLR